MTTNKINIRKIEEKLTDINKKIDDFQSKLQDLPEKVDSKFAPIVSELKDKKSVLRDRLDHFEGATETAYKDLQTGVQMAWEDLNIAYESARERFEKEAS